MPWPTRLRKRRLVVPAALRSHIRYPKALLGLQAEILLQYHQDTPPRFHGQQDVWAPPQELAEGSRPVPYLPEYGFYRLPGSASGGTGLGLSVSRGIVEAHGGRIWAENRPGGGTTLVVLLPAHEEE